MADAARKVATYDDVLAAPPHMVAEIVDGELILSPRPASAHGAAASTLGEELGPPFKRGRGGPGGWIIVDEPELHLAGNVLVPDLAGWRRERMALLSTRGTTAGGTAVSDNAGGAGGSSVSGGSKASGT